MRTAIAVLCVLLLPLAAATRAAALFEEYTTLHDLELWDSQIVAGWRSSPAAGVAIPDWELFRPDSHASGQLGTVGIPRTRPLLRDLDLDGDNFINRTEFGRFVREMEQMPPELATALAAQHRIQPGDQVRWAGEQGGWPWSSDQPTTTALSYARDYEGQVYMLVASPGDTIPAPRDGSLQPGTPGRRVRVSQLEPATGQAQHARLEQTSADQLFDRLARGRPALAARECQTLGMQRMLTDAQWSAVVRRGWLLKAQFVQLFNRYQFLPALVAAAADARSSQAKAEREAGQSSCGVRLHCLSVADVRESWPELEPTSIQADEWRRFGRLTTTKAAGWTNGLALVDAFGRLFEQRRAEEATVSSNEGVLAAAKAEAEKQDAAARRRAAAEEAARQQAAEEEEAARQRAAEEATMRQRRAAEEAARQQAAEEEEAARQRAAEEAMIRQAREQEQTEELGQKAWLRHQYPHGHPGRHTFAREGIFDSRVSW